MKTTSYSAFAAIDWADSRNYLHLCSSKGEVLQSAYFPNNAQGYDWLLQTLEQARGGGPIAIIIEATRAAPADILSRYDWLHLFPVHPVVTRRLNDLHGSGKGKSDRRDSELMCGHLRSSHAKMNRRQADIDAIEQLREDESLEADLGHDLRQYKQRIRSQVRRFHPQVEQLLGDLDAAVHVKYLLEFDPLHPADIEEVRCFLRHNSVRAADFVERFLEVHRQLRPLPGSAAVQRSQLEVLRGYARILLHLQQELATVRRRMEKTLARVPYAAILRSLPGVGPVLACRLACLLGSIPGKRFANARQAAAFCGQSPLTESSGGDGINTGRMYISKRVNCNRRARNLLFLWCRCAVMQQKDPWIAQMSKRLKQRGDKTPTRYRKIGQKLLAILQCCLETNQPYDEQIFRKNSHLYS